MERTNMDGEFKEPLLLLSSSSISNGSDVEEDLKSRVWMESKKLWIIVGPSIISRVAAYSMNVVPQAFAGHLGDTQLASMSIALTVIAGFDFGLLLGMASALETLCGQAYGAKRYHMLGIYMQRSWIVLSLCCVVLLPIYLFPTPVMKLLGQPDEVAELTGSVAQWFIPMHFAFAFVFPLQRFLQSQIKAHVLAYASAASLLVNFVGTWILVSKLELGVVGAAIGLDISWWFFILVLFGYVVLGGCPETWPGFSASAFIGILDFIKLSAASGVMLWKHEGCCYCCGCFIGLHGNQWMGNDDTSCLLCCNRCTLHRVRVANELGAGSAKRAKFATKVAVAHSTIIGIFFCTLIILVNDKLALIFSTSHDVLRAVDKLSYLLGVTILLNSIQPVISGVAVGSGWQGQVAYINIFCYYFVGIPIGVIMRWVFHLGVEGIWGGMIFGTAIQTVILVFMTVYCDWEKEVEKAALRLQNWSTSKSSEDSS